MIKKFRVLSFIFLTSVLNISFAQQNLGKDEVKQQTSEKTEEDKDNFIIDKHTLPEGMEIVLDKNQLTVKNNTAIDKDTVGKDTVINKESNLDEKQLMAAINKKWQYFTFSGRGGEEFIATNDFLIKKTKNGGFFWLDVNASCQGKNKIKIEFFDNFKNLEKIQCDGFGEVKWVEISNLLKSQIGQIIVKNEKAVNDIFDKKKILETLGFLLDEKEFKRMEIEEQTAIFIKDKLLLLNEQNYRHSCKYKYVSKDNMSINFSNGVNFVLDNRGLIFEYEIDGRKVLERNYKDESTLKEVTKTMLDFIEKIKGYEENDFLLELKNSGEKYNSNKW